MFVVLPTKTKICIQSERNFKVDITKPGQKHFPAFSGDTDWMKVERCFTDDSLLSYLANRNEMQSLSPVYLSSFLNPWQNFFERVIEFWWDWNKPPRDAREMRRNFGSGK